MCFSAPKAPTVLEAPAVATEVDDSVQKAREQQRKRLEAARFGSTLLNGGQGITDSPASQPKTLLGS